LAKNIITLSLKDFDSFKLIPGISDSIKSNFAIYLKENIYKYIDIKNRISDQLIEHSNRISKAIETFSDTFKNNLIGFITFFISVIVINSIASKSIIYVFNDTIASISYVILLVSACYLLFSLHELDMKEKRFHSSYKNLKTRYQFLLTAEDIANVFNNNKANEDDLQYFEQNKRNYSYLWLIFIFSSFFVIFILNYIHF
jgi:hypothetical protein